MFATYRKYLFALFFAISLLADFYTPYTAFAISDSETIGILTGPKTGTYFVFGNDIATTASSTPGITIDVKPSSGSIDNIKRLNSDENASLAIVQSDVLGFLTRSKDSKTMNMAKNLRIVFPLYSEEVHVLARKEIKDFKDLEGKTVAIGEDLSGNMVTSANLFHITGITPGKTINISPEQGVISMLKGEVDAAIFVGGKPVRLFKNLEDLTLPENQKYAAMLEKVHFIPMDSPKMLEEYKPAKITANDYKFVKQDVATISVPAILISYDFSQGKTKKRCEQLANLANGIRIELARLKQTGHLKWKEVDLDAKIGSWKKDACVWPDTLLKKPSTSTDQPK